MTKEEYLKEKEDLKKKYQTSISLLDLKFCTSKAIPCGTIIKDHVGYGRIKSFKVYHDYGAYGKDYTPVCSYECDNLTKKMEVNKREPIRYIYEGNIQEVLDNK